MGNGEDSPTSQEAAGSETGSGGQSDAWLERRLRVFERALNALEERQERSERNHTVALGRFEERVRLDEERLTEVENHFGESHRALQKAIEDAAQRLHTPEPEPIIETPAEIPSEKPAEEIVYVEVEPVVQPTKPDLEFLALARKAAIEASTQIEKGKCKVRSLTKPLIICLLALSLSMAAAAIILRHGPGTGSAIAAPAGFGKIARHEVVDPNHRLEVLADAGNRRAMHVLAMQLADHRDMVNAAAWFKRAAAMGYDDSQFNLAILYERGDGVSQSFVQAYIWYSIAARGDDEEAAERAEVLRTQLKPAQLSVAERAINEFKPEPFDASAQTAPLHIDHQAG